MNKGYTQTLRKERLVVHFIEHNCSDLTACVPACNRLGLDVTVEEYARLAILGSYTVRNIPCHKHCNRRSQVHFLLKRHSHWKLIDELMNKKIITDVGNLYLGYCSDSSLDGSTTFLTCRTAII